MNEGESVAAAVRQSVKRQLVGVIIGSVLMMVVIGGLLFAAFAAERAGNAAEGTRLFVGLAVTGAVVVTVFLILGVYLLLRGRVIRRRLALLTERYPEGVAVLLQRPRIAVSPGVPTEWDAIRFVSIHGVVVQHRSIALLSITDRIEIIGQADDADITVTATTRELNNMTIGQLSFRVRAEGLDANVDGIPAARSFSVPTVATLNELLSVIRAKAGPSRLEAT